MTANEKLLDDAITEALAQQGLANNVARRMLNLLKKSDVDLMVQIQKALETLPPESFRVARLESILKSSREITDAIYLELDKKLSTELEGVASYEIEHQTSILNSVLAGAVELERVSINQVYASAMAQPFQGRLLKDWFITLADSQKKAISDAIAIGYTENESISQIVARIRGTKALDYKNGVLQIKKRNAEAIVRTAISHISAFSRTQLFKANENVIKGLKWVATLDSRTTIICASRDGKIYDLGKAPAIPAHINCRSSLAPVLKSWREMGLDIDELPESTRSSLDGQIPAETTYQAWLKTKPVDFQNKVLGETKAKLFRDGGLKLDRFVNRAGYEYTIDELRARDAQAFKRAGL